MMKYYQKDGSNKNLIVALHGTGGSATDLLSVAKFIDPLATFIGLQGEVIESGMARFFERYHDGSFNLESLNEATIKLHKTLLNIVAGYEKVTLLGYSNGANLLMSYLKEYENVKADNIFLFHPSLTKMSQAFKNQKATILVTAGKQDPYLSQLQLNQLSNQLESSYLQFEILTHEFGHQLRREELIKVKEIYQK